VHGDAEALDRAHQLVHPVGPQQRLAAEHHQRLLGALQHLHGVAQLGAGRLAGHAGGRLADLDPAAEREGLREVGLHVGALQVLDRGLVGLVGRLRRPLPHR
ncbi:MAG: hypothetical protein ACK559_13510, partial [bacterium]